MDKCNNCRGSGKVEEKVDCPACTDGRVWLIDAFGKPYSNPCGRCSGSGSIYVKVTCSFCDGKGRN